ncbi:twin-arginine translocase TatA/TatE family subunit [Paenibacillus agaridevorans]|uniref:twin-arginine translocase TatA/TatE family subunit n=1 Tax=Paenibacillus agaridevorans TaxID=171404 RepID=UPI001BE408C9|nr:twin-arginine translocase TatA/TatE family subunit [Paenibacillus agaridevorans]
MPMNFGVSGIVLIVILGLLLFGPSKLPQLGRAIGSTFLEFKRGFGGGVDPEKQPKPEEEKEQLQAGKGSNHL